MTDAAFRSIVIVFLGAVCVAVPQVIAQNDAEAEPVAPESAVMAAEAEAPELLPATDMGAEDESEDVATSEVDVESTEPESEPVAVEQNEATEPDTPVAPVEEADAEPIPLTTEVPEDLIAVTVDDETATDEPTDESRDGLISITLDEVELVDVVRMFTRISGANIIASATNLTGTVTVNLTDVQWKPALSSILDMHMLALVEKTPGSGVYSIITKSPDAPEPMIAETIFLQYTTVSEMNGVIRSMLTGGGMVSEFASRNALVVRTTASNMGEIKELIKSIDIQGRQVCIETKFLELSDAASEKIGIKWDSLDEFGLSLGAGPFSSSKSITRSKSRDDSSSRWDTRGNVDEDARMYDMYGNQIQDTDYTTLDVGDDTMLIEDVTATRTVTDTIDTGKDVSSDILDSFTSEITESQASILELDTLELVLSALKTTDGVSIISNPKLIVANGATNAVFSVGTREPIIKTEVTAGTTESPGDTTTASLDTSINTEYITEGYLETGIELRVIPVVKTDDLIEAEIVPSLRRKTGEKTIGENSWPIISVKEIRTKFSLRSGQTVAIGGLTDTTESKATTKVPLLGDIPLIGKYLFSHTEDVKSQVETIIFVTLSLADPIALRKEEGIPEGAELIHTKLLKQKSRRQEFMAGLEEAQRAADEDLATMAEREKRRLLKKRN